MKKSVIFLINGLGIERPGSYSISIDQCMPNLSKIKETSYFTTAVTDSIEYKDAYQRFFLGDTYRSEVDYIKDYVIKDSLKQNPVFKQLSQSCGGSNHKLHVFVEPTNDKVVEQINRLVQMLPLDQDKQIYLHLILSQQVIKDYSKIISIVNYIQYHLDNRITVGFIMGKDSVSNPMSKEQLDYMKKMFFYCTCERWTETDKKLQILESEKVRPCDVKGFCATNKCSIMSGDSVLFFNTRRQDYDAFIDAIALNEKAIFNKLTISFYSLLQLDSKYAIPYFVQNIEYEDSLSNMLLRNQKKMLIITDDENINLVNYYANGLNSINNPIICFMQKTEDLYKKEYIERLINEMPYDLILFDYHMDTSSTINHLKDELSKIDVILGHLAEVCENRHSLFITSLYGLHKSLPLADYNPEMVTINYEMMIPIFFFDYYYPKSKYDLFPGETNDILRSALNCITNDPKIDSLVREKTFLGSIVKSFIR